MVTSPYQDIPLLSDTCPAAERVIPMIVRGGDLRALRGQPTVIAADLGPALRELWAEATEETAFIPNREELAGLRHMLGTDGWLERLRTDPGDTLRALQEGVRTGDENQAARVTLTGAAMIGACTPQDLARPDVQFALETIHPTQGGPLIQGSLIISALLRAILRAPDVAWHWLSRLNLSDLSTGVTEVQATQLDSDIPEVCGPGPDIAAGLLNRNLLAYGMQAAFAQVCTPRLRRELALASWRSGVYDRSRHPHLSLDTLISLSSPNLHVTLKQKGARGVAARAAACLGVGQAHPHSPLVSAATERSDLLLCSSGQLLRWSHDHITPQVSALRARTAQAKLQNLQAKFAAIPLIRDEGEQTWLDELAVAALILCASQPDYGLPNFQESAAHLGSQMYELPRLNSKRVRGALEAVDTLPGVNRAVGRAAKEAAALLEQA